MKIFNQKKVTYSQKGEIVAIKGWVQNEVKHMQFKDSRITKRCKQLLEQLSERPGSSIPAACASKASTKAAYRFFDNAKAEVDEIRKGFFKATAERIKEHKIILMPSDASNLVYTSHKSLKGKGVLRNFKASGLSMHSGFAITPEGQPLGLYYQHVWGRKAEDYGKRLHRTKLPIEQKESFRWLESLVAAEKALHPSTKGVFIGDRGADIAELFLYPRASNVELLIRSLHNRHLSDKSRLFEKLDNLSQAGTMNVLISRAPGRDERIAVCSVSYTSVQIKHNKSANPLIVNAIIVKEVNSSNIDKPIIWRLLTTMTITSLQDAVTYIEWYVKRWSIERYHYTLKSGCNVEELQLEDSKRIERAIVLYSIIAWRLMFVTYAARTNSEAECTQILDNDEWKALYCFFYKKSTLPIILPTIKEAVLMLAKLGGFLGRKNDGSPGIKVIWRGLRRLEDIVESYKIFVI